MLGSELGPRGFVADVRGWDDIHPAARASVGRGKEMRR